MALADEIDALNFEVERSIRYHQRRRAFFEGLHRSAMFVVILSGSAAVANLAPAVAGGVTTVVGALDLTIGFSSKARDHQVLAQRFSDLARQVRKTAEPTEAGLRGWQDDKLAIDADEPPIYRALEADCYNEVCRAWDRPSPYAPKLTLAQKLLMHCWRFEGGNFPPPQTAHAA